MHFFPFSCSIILNRVKIFNPSLRQLHHLSLSLSPLLHSTKLSRSLPLCMLTMEIQEVQSSSSSSSSSREEEVKLAAIAISLNIRLRSADMPRTMQERALRYTRSLLDSSSSSSSSSNRRPSPTLLARSLKKEFDLRYGPAWHCVVGKSFGSFVTHSPEEFDLSHGPAWHCVVGKSFGSFVTHSPGGFVYFTFDSGVFWQQ
ncbi:unnamed protein product [Camellia sinensis]